MTTSFTVISVKKSDSGRINEVLSDDIVSRQSIHTRESDLLGLGTGLLFVKVEGNPMGVKRAEELFEKAKIGTVADKKTADKVRQAIQDEEDAAAGGMGMIFG